jgi:hypothetical protein
MLFWLCFKLPCGVYFIANYIRLHPFGKVLSVFSTFKELQIGAVVFVRGSLGRALVGSVSHRSHLIVKVA